MNQEIDFDKEFELGNECYNNSVGDWWYSRSMDYTHQKAYRNIVKYMKESISKLNISPEFIVDYACGPGSMLALLAKSFPNSKIIGLDGSRKMLEHASNFLIKKKIKFKFAKPEDAFDEDESQVRLVETKLPNFSLPKEKADVVLFMFPNIVPKDEEQEYYDGHGYKNQNDEAVGKELANFKEEDSKDNPKDDPEELLDQILTLKVISRNISNLLKSNGMQFRVEYSASKREELTDGEQLRTKFEEGSLDKEINDKKAEQIFKLADSVYKRSKVILDVYHQTKDEEDKKGGYMISTLQRIESPLVCSNFNECNSYSA